MFRRFIALTLALLLAGQSVAAGMDLHLDMQGTDEHHQAGHTHAEQSSHADISLMHKLVDAVTDHELSHDRDESQSLDCGHCCHCHNGTQVVAMVAQSGAMAPVSGGDTVYRLRIPTLKFPPALRPPNV